MQEIGILTTGAKQDLLFVIFYLTNEGKDKIEEIIKEFYSYINIIKEKGISENYWNNFADIINLQNKYKLDSNVDPFSISTNLAINLLKGDYKNFLIGANLKYNESNIKSFLNDINTKNMIINIHSDNDKILQNKNLFSTELIEIKLRDFNT